MVKSWRTKKQIKASLSINRRGRPKMSYFWSLNKKEKWEEEEEEEESDQAKVWIHDFCKDIWSLAWNLSME